MFKMVPYLSSLPPLNRTKPIKLTRLPLAQCKGFSLSFAICFPSWFCRLFLMVYDWFIEMLTVYTNLAKLHVIYRGVTKQNLGISLVCIDQRCVFRHATVWKPSPFPETQRVATAPEGQMPIALDTLMTETNNVQTIKPSTWAWALTTKKQGKTGGIFTWRKK